MNAADASLQVARRPRRVAPVVTVLVLGALAAFLLYRGYDFYRQDAVARTDHPDYAELRAAGRVGHGYGIVGTGLILTNLLYLVRRRFTQLLPRQLGSIRAWLDVHVITGLSGALLILFHSAFQLRTTIAAVTAACLAIVVVTGLVGLYLHALLPTAGIKPLRARLDELRPHLPGLVHRIDACVKENSATKLPADASLLQALATVPRWIAEARARRRGVREAARADKLFRAVDDRDRALARSLVAELSDLAAREVDTNAGTALMRSWRSLHRLLAILMVFSVTVHIVVAWFYGFRWIFSA